MKFSRAHTGKEEKRTGDREHQGKMELVKLRQGRNMKTKLI